MQLVLTEKEDLLKYIEFLSSEDSLNEVTLNKEDTKKYLAFCSQAVEPTRVHLTQKTWSTHEDEYLSSAITRGESLSDVMSILGRVEGSVKSRANKIHRKGYNKKNNSWYDLD